jgi:membrane protease YdiL (CAAX protease family)
VPLAGDNLFARQGIVWIANVIMLFLIWLGLYLRGQSWSHFGLSFKKPTFSGLIRIVLLSFIVLAASIVGYFIGSTIMINIAGLPEQADLSSYNYIEGNLPMLILALIGVYIVSSFGEEVIYRAFLINRIEELGSGNKFITVAAVVVSSVIFGLIHFEWGTTGIVQTGFFGLALALCYIFLKRNLWVLVLAHAYMDTILMVQMYFGTG